MCVQNKFCALIRKIYLLAMRPSQMIPLGITQGFAPRPDAKNLLRLMLKIAIHVFLRLNIIFHCTIALNWQYLQ